MHNLKRFLLSSCLLAFIALAGWGCDEHHGSGDGNGVQEPAPEEDIHKRLRADADKAFNGLKGVFDPAMDCTDGVPDEKCNYWQLGHAFDTIIDYFLMITKDTKDSGTRGSIDTNGNNSKTIEGFRDIVFKTWNNTEGPENKSGPACWYDDFGWWGIAALKASRQTFWGDETDVTVKLDSCMGNGKPGTPVDQFRQMADCAWSQFNSFSTQVFELCKMNEFPQPMDCEMRFGNIFGPLFDGGVWNYVWAFGRPDQCNSPCDPTLCSDDPKDDIYCTTLDKKKCNACNLCGIQNTVTNGLYLILSSERDETVEAENELAFLMNWFDSDKITEKISAEDKKDKALLNRDIKPVNAGVGSDVPLAVVRERVSMYDGERDVKNFRKDLSWTGDQGLILGGLVDQMNTLDINSDDYHKLLNLAKEIINGVTFYMVDDKGILLPWKDPASSGSLSLCKPNSDCVQLPIGDPPGLDYPDHNTGPGVYMRYLLHAFKTNEDLRVFLLGKPYQDFVRTNALAVLDGADLCAPTTFCPTQPKETNKLATLVAAFEMIPKQCDLQNKDSSCQVCADAMPQSEACCPIPDPITGNAGCGTVIGVFEDTLCRNEFDKACLIGE